MTEFNRDKRKEVADFNAKQEARYEAMRQSKYSSIVYKQHEELQRRFDKHAQILDKNKNSLASEIKKIRNKRREYRDKYSELKSKLNYYGLSSSISESRISTMHHKMSYFRQSQEVKQFFNKFNIANEEKPVSYRSGNIPTLPKISPYAGMKGKYMQSNSERMNLKKKNSETTVKTLPSLQSNSENERQLLKLEWKRHVEHYKPLEKPSMYLFSINNINDRSIVHGKYFPGI